jgi:hypothetical protein
MTWEEIAAIGCALPDVAESTSYARPSLKVRGKYFAGLNLKEKALVLKLADLDEQDFLIESAPAIYFITDHYKGWPYVLARLSKLTKKECRGRLERAWRLAAPKSLLKKVDAT